MSDSPNNDNGKNSIQSLQNAATTSYTGKLHTARQHGVQALTVLVTQSPTPENDNTAICLASLTTADGKIFSDVGDANPHNVPQDCVCNLISIASDRAKDRTLHSASLCIGVNQQKLPWDMEGEIIPAGYQEIAPQKALPTGAAMKNGGGNKPVSDKQLGLINRLCEGHGHDPNALAIEMFGKYQTDLLGSEADRIIKRLRQ